MQPWVCWAWRGLEFEPRLFCFLPKSQVITWPYRNWHWTKLAVSVEASGISPDTCMAHSRYEMVTGGAMSRRRIRVLSKSASPRLPRDSRILTQTRYADFRSHKIKLSNHLIYILNRVLGYCHEWSRPTSTSRLLICDGIDQICSYRRVATELFSSSAAPNPIFARWKWSVVRRWGCQLQNVLCYKDGINYDIKALNFVLFFKNLSI
jgi:hypothetical protein